MNGISGAIVALVHCSGDFVIFLVYFSSGVF